MLTTHNGLVIPVLISRIKSLEVETAYLKEYVHYLTGGYTKEEFKRIAAKYAQPMKLSRHINARLLDINVDKIAKTITEKILMDMTRDHILSEVTREVIKCIVNREYDMESDLIINFYICVRYPREDL